MDLTVGSIGLIFDLYGTFWLAKSVIWRTKNQINLETATFWDDNPYLRLSQEISRVWGWVGFVSLFIGFGLQFLGQVINFKVHSNLVLVLVALILAFGLISNRIVINHFNKKLPREFRERYGSLK